MGNATLNNALANVASESSAKEAKAARLAKLQAETAAKRAAVVPEKVKEEGWVAPKFSSPVEPPTQIPEAAQTTYQRVGPPTLKVIALVKANFICSITFECTDLSGSSAHILCRFSASGKSAGFPKI